MREFLDARCAARGDAPFLRFRERIWSYTDLGRITDGAGAALLRLGLKRGDRVALLLPNGPDALFAWLALAKIGAITAPLHPQLTPAEVDRALRFLEPAAFAFDPALWPEGAGELPPGARAVPLQDLRGILDSRDGLSVAETTRPEDPADILMTSGTTGRPKGVIQSHRTYRLTGEGFAHWLRLTPVDRLFTCLPLSHVNARAYSVMGTLASGASLVLEERFSAARFWGWLADSDATEANTIGAMLHILMKAPPCDADRRHRVRLVYSAPALGERDHRAFERRFGVRLVIGYGLTESTFGFIHPLDAPLSAPAAARRLGSMGKVRRHPDASLRCEARLVVSPDEGGAPAREAGPGEIGEIWLRNPALFSGYLHDEEATRQALSQDGWLRTGDLATHDEDGWYTFVARAKEIIRRRGENVAPAEVEAVLREHPLVREAAVIGVPSPLGEEEIAAFVVLDPGAKLTQEQLREHAAGRLAGFKVPSIWRFPASLPRTSTQRVAKHLLTLD